MTRSLLNLVCGRRSVPFALAAYLVCPVCPAQQVGDDGTPDAAAIVTESHDFLDGEDGRVLGDIRASLIYAPPAGDPTAEPEIRLRVVVSAIGPLVDGVAGFAGVRGGNVITAEQLGHLVSGFVPLDVITVSTDPRTGQAGIAWGQVRVGEVGRIPMRRLGADGRIDFEAESAEVPLELIIESGPLDDGDHHTVFEVAGLPRLQVVHSRHGGSGDIEIIEQPVMHPSDDEAIRAALQVARTQTERRGRALQPDGARQIGARHFETPRVIPADVVAWRALDPEVQWLQLTESLADNPDGWLEWRGFLVREQAWQLLEWMAISRPNGFASLGIGQTLADNDAPNWVRVAVWLMRNSFGHGGDAAKQLLASQDPGLVLGWLRAHPQLRVRDAVTLLEGELNAAKVEPKDASSQWPPLTLDDVAGPMMDTPLVLPVLSSSGAEKPLPNALYVHQVVRAVNAYIVATGDHYFRDLIAPDGIPWKTHYLNGVQHSHADIRQATFLGGTSLYGVIPFETSRSIARLEDEEDRVREAALLCMSYVGSHPGVYAELALFALDYPHPAWRAAVSRLGDIGTEVAVEALRPSLVDPAITPDDRAFLQANWNRMRTRLAQSNPTPYPDLIEHVVWANSHGEAGLHAPTMLLLQDRIDNGEITLASLEKSMSYDPDPKDEIYTSDFYYDKQWRESVYRELIKYAQAPADP